MIKYTHEARNLLENTLRPIVPSMGAFNYNLASFLGEMAKTVTPTDIAVQILFVSQRNYIYTVSFDICSLFTNIPLHETIDLAVDHIMENKRPYP